MMNNELAQIARKLEHATTPEEVFGPVSGRGDAGLEELKRIYHQLAMLTHPDRYGDPAELAVAQATFPRLTSWYAGAESKMKAGTYGQSDHAAGQTLQTKKRLYHLAGDYSSGPIYSVYPGTLLDDGQPIGVSIKIVRELCDNDLAQNEAQVIQALRSGPEAAKFAAYLPRLVESFFYPEGMAVRQGSAFERPEGWYSLAEVREVYPRGVNPKDMAWMWRRLLTVLGYAHRCQVIHGAVLPGNILIQPEQHGLMLWEWSFAVDGLRCPGAIIPAIDPAYEAWYPEEVWRKEAPLPGTDLGMAARCMIDLLGGDPINKLMPDSVPNAIQLFLKGCTLPGKLARPQDAWALLEEFDQRIERLWGERKFHPFSMRK